METLYIADALQVLQYGHRGKKYLLERTPRWVFERKKELKGVLGAFRSELVGLLKELL